MHTDPKDPHGQDLPEIMRRFGLTNKQVMLSTDKIDPRHLAALYNVADCTINISDAEGFGLSTLESLSCGTPIIVNMTGGLQEQITNGVDFFGFPLYPSSKALIGSQNVPYIYEDRLDKAQVVDAMYKMYSLPPEQRKLMGKNGWNHVQKNYNFSNYKSKWAEIMESVYQKHQANKYNNILFKEVA